MPGKIFINETADKQKVELTTGADGVTGGYYDADGAWHDFGGGESEFATVTLTLTEGSEKIIGGAIYSVYVEYPEGVYVNTSPEDLESSLTLKVLKNSSIVELYGTIEDENHCVLVDGTAHVYQDDEFHFIYFTEDGQTALLDNK